MPYPELVKAAVSNTIMRILIVEDHADTAAVLERLLCKLGHQCEIAPTLAAAAAQTAQIKFDVALIDMGLPDGNGKTLGPTFHQKGITCIAITGSNPDELTDVASSFTAILTKPLNFTNLTALLNTLISSPGTPGEGVGRV